MDDPQSELEVHDVLRDVEEARERAHYEGERDRPMLHNSAAPDRFHDWLNGGDYRLVCPCCGAAKPKPIES